MLKINLIHVSLIHIASCKEGKVTPKDVLEIVATIVPETATYKQAQQVIDKMESANYQSKNSSFVLKLEFLFS
jgi:hypothetical protein